MYWYTHLTKAFEDKGFTKSEHDPCMMFGRGMIVLIYVDDCLFFGPDGDNIDAFVKKYSNQSPSNKHPQETKKLSSLEEQAHAYAQERAKERGYSENPNDVSFVSDSKLLQV